MSRVVWVVWCLGVGGWISWMSVHQYHDLEMRRLTSSSLNAWRALNSVDTSSSDNDSRSSSSSSSSSTSHTKGVFPVVDQYNSINNDDTDDGGDEEEDAHDDDDDDEITIVDPSIISSIYPHAFKNESKSSLTRMKLAKAATTTKTTREERAKEVSIIKQWRRNIVDQCNKNDNVNGATMADNNPYTLFSHAVRTKKNDDDDDDESDDKNNNQKLNSIRACRHVILDFGANVGDTSAKVIDAGIPECHQDDRNNNNGNNQKTRRKMNGMRGVESSVYVFDVTNQTFVSARSRNPLSNAFSTLILEQQQQQQPQPDPVNSDTSQTSSSSLPRGPEDYCYYGVEGNPVFTQRLQLLEQSIMNIVPRPLEHIHFYTESVGAGIDKETVLFLDTINAKQNYWGSSIMEHHQDVRKSAQTTKDGTVVSVPVMGYTIGTLMHQTLRAMAHDATPQERIGSHLIIKVDIEGGEYPLLAQAAKNETICDFVAAGNTADLYIEWHSSRVTGSHSYDKQEIIQSLTKCGVTFRKLGAHWH
jgi:hypothetical protein